MVKVERLSENRVKLVVTVSAEQFDLALDAAFEKVVKDIKVDGFRPGKLPKSIYISRFGWESLYNEAIDYLIMCYNCGNDFIKLLVIYVKFCIVIYATDVEVHHFHVGSNANSNYYKENQINFLMQENRELREKINKKHN